MAHAITTTVSHTASFSFSSFVSSMINAAETAKQRRQLARLSDEQLNDIGITSAQAAVEAARPSYFA